ncbi:biotin-dependent carboxyltransferase family protein [Moritella sp. Urea-trap-13]|uniref:5-oxoprolinase subunit C family protein n=1 Tax=Moritella sp. Urea-trap-13 TaxID=2058327 RepID=UPI000C323365|nr:biotin-dependent carboxyltransferase family protein [Moritella sp. Urea-trap-13]PKH07982.1 regulator of kinase autophosphorylation inhibitor [Moritella sp. Urea-trap-13]
MTNVSAFEVIKPGIHSLIQDLGRFGYQHLGITPGGPADLHAYLWANKILSNSSNMASIEIHYGLMTLKILVDTQMAICGAEFGVTINNKPAFNWQTHHVKSGDVIQYGGAKTGKCGYLAIVGGLQTEKIYQSRSTVIRDELSQVTSSPLYQGQLLPITTMRCAKTAGLQTEIAVPRHYIPNYATPLSLGLSPCYQWPLLTSKQQHQLLSNKYQISTQANRMGYQLIGDVITDLPTSLISEGIALGSVQLPANGLPIILLQDRQTIGGYPKAGVISALDCGKLSQRQQGSEITFRLDNPLVSRYKMQAFKRFFDF